MLIHFVCKGNVYRSRLAAAYLNSKQIPDITAVSSGIAADENANGMICWEAQRIIQNNNLTEFESCRWKKTTGELLNKADLVVFMQEAYYLYCRDNLGYNRTDYEIFDVKDLGDYGYTDNFISLEKDIEKITLTEKTFAIIQTKVDNLIKKITSMVKFSHG